MAAAVDNRYAGNVAGPGVGHSSPAMASSAELSGGWMSRKKRAIVFAVIGNAITLGLFLPAIIFIARDFDTMRGNCGDDIVIRGLTTACFFIFHSLLVTPMFTRGDRGYATNNGYNTYSAFYRTHLAHTATVLQVVGNLIEWALLAWTASAFWREGLSGTCQSSHNGFYNYMWAMLIGGMFFSTLSLITAAWQYSSAALRFNPLYAKHAGGQGGLVNAP